MAMSYLPNRVQVQSRRNVTVDQIKEYVVFLYENTRFYLSNYEKILHLFIYDLYVFW